MKCRQFAKKISMFLGTTLLLGSLLSVPAFAAETVRVGAMSGPTAMGMVKLMDDAENQATEGSYEFAELSTEASAFVAPLAQGDIDIAAVPSNLASVIYNNTEGGVQVLAINVLSVLNIVERGDSVKSIADLKGKTIYATGQGATPEAALTYILTKNEMSPETDLTIQWCADTTEALSFISEDPAAIAMLPQPFVTAACSKVEDLNVSFSLADAWAEVDPDSSIVTGVLVVRSAFAEEHPEEVALFLKEYEASKAFTEEDPAAAAELIAKYGILAAAPLAQKALPSCSVSFITGDEMKAALSSYLDILNNVNPKLVGGALPGDDFYYGCE